MEINTRNLEYIELMARSMADSLKHAIDDYVAIHDIDHHDVGVVLVPFVVGPLPETKEDVVPNAEVHTLLTSTSINRDNVINILQGVVDKMKAGAGIPLGQRKPTDA